MAVDMGAPTSLLDLPPELRRDIFIFLFRSTTIRSIEASRRRPKNTLAILLVCRQLYAEAAPLALPNVRVCCYQNHELLDTRFRIGPERIHTSGTWLCRTRLSDLTLGFWAWRARTMRTGTAAIPAKK